MSDSAPGRLNARMLMARSLVPRSLTGRATDSSGRPRRRAHGRWLGLTVVLLVASPAVASAPGVRADEANTACADSVAACVEQGETFVLIPGSANIISAHMPIRDTNKAHKTYAELLPDGFEMPAQPRFLLHAAEYFGGTDAPIVQDVPGVVEGNGNAGYGTHWIEMSMHMRVARTYADGSSEEGWYFIGIGTDGNIAYGGIDSGYPKYRAHTTFDRRDGRNVPSYWRAVATVVGRPELAHADPSTNTTTMQVAWREDASRELPAEAEQTMVGYWMNPVHQGPSTERSVGRFMSPAEASWLTGGAAPDATAVPPVTALDERPGLVDYTLEPDLARYDDASEKSVPSLLATKATMADMVDVTGTVPGWAFEVKQGYLFNQQRQIRTADGTGS